MNYIIKIKNIEKIQNFYFKYLNKIVFNYLR